MELKKITEKQYDEYLIGKDNISIQMRSGMKRMLEKTGWTCHYIGMADGDTIVATAMLCGKPMKFAGMYYTCQYGPHIDFDNADLVRAFFTQLPAILKELGTTNFEFNPNLVWQQYTPDGELYNTNEYPNLKILEELGYVHHDINQNTNGRWDMRFHYVKDLTDLDDKSLIKSYNSQAKRSVKKAIQNGIEVIEVPYNQTDDMHKLMEMSASKHGYTARDAGYYERANEDLGDNARFLLARLDVEQYLTDKRGEVEDSIAKIERFAGTKKEKQIPDLKRKVETLKADIEVIANSQDVVDGYLLLSAGAFLINGPEMIYLFGGNDGNYQKFCSSFAMQDYAMRLAIELGLKEFNMYGIDGVFDGSDSVLRFKSSFGGHINAFVGTYQLLMKPGKLKRANFIKKLVRR